LRNRLIASGCALFGVASLLSALPATARQGNAPFAGGGAQANAKDPEVDKLTAAAVKLAKQSKAKPKDAKLKEKAAEAYYQAGHASMVSPNLPPRSKYRGALGHFRSALALNPKHKKAADEKKMIEDIYKQMGRPVPS
jgi:hypothetical protein